MNHIAPCYGLSISRQPHFILLLIFILYLVIKQIKYQCTERNRDQHIISRLHFCKIAECQTDSQRYQIQAYLFFAFYNTLCNKPSKKCRYSKIKCGLQGFIL